MLSRVRRQPRHAAKRARRRRRQVHPSGCRCRISTCPGPICTCPGPHLHLPRLHVPRPRLRMPSSPIPAVVAFVARWRGGRATLSLERRRARTMLIGAIVFACIVLLTSFPIGGLLSQRSALSGTAHELTTVKAENEVLARQVADLSNPATVNDLARQDYGFVPKGQRVYDILPSLEPVAARALAASGQVPLNGPPVVPGSARSQALIGVVAPAGRRARPSRPRAPGTVRRDGAARRRQRPLRPSPTATGGGWSGAWSSGTDHVLRTRSASPIGRRWPVCSGARPAGALHRGRAPPRRDAGGHRERPAARRRAAHAHPVLAGRRRGAATP